jgi:hypothetical protein
MRHPKAQEANINSVHTDMSLNERMHTTTPSIREAIALWTAWGVLVVGAFLPFAITGVVAAGVAFVLPGYLIETRVARMPQLEMVQRIGIWFVLSIMSWIVIALPTILFGRSLHWGLTFTVAFSLLAVGVYYATRHSGEPI